jgi:hypothetical protein
MCKEAKDQRALEGPRSPRTPRPWNVRYRPERDADEEGAYELIGEVEAPDRLVSEVMKWEVL